MTLIIALYILNSTLLLLHEIESAYEKEWEILKLPGKITGFLILHLPIIFLLFYGLLELNKFSKIGIAIGLLSGIGGVLPFFVHKVFVKKKDKFILPLSRIIIYSNLITGIVLAGLIFRKY
ncbi:MAG: DUF6713 family protein [Pseudomonadota bacterium]